MKKNIASAIIVTSLFFCVSSCGNLMNDILSEITAGLNTRSVTYDGNGNSGGSVPIDGNTYPEGAQVEILDNTEGLEKKSFSFAGWNSTADGSGTDYIPGQTFTMGNSDLTLFAKWAVVAVTAVTLNTNNTVIPVGFTDRLTAFVVPANATNKSINWSSSDQNVVIVDSEGLLTSVAEGTAIITVTSADGGLTDECTVEIIAPPATQEHKLLADDGALGDNFGISVALYGDCAIIGASYDDDNGTSSGSAYVFTRNHDTGSWEETAKLTASDAAAGDSFGNAVALTEGRAIIAAERADGNDTNSGAAYVFERDGSGAWIEKAKLIASDGAENDTFGESVAISGNYVIIGAFCDDDKGTDSGAAFVFERDGSGVWSEKAKLLASDGDVNAFLGRSAAIIGEYAMVGGPNSNGGDGAVYTYKRDESGNWDETGILTPSDNGAAYAEHFGNSISISGDYALIGSWYDDDKGTESGSAYVFKRNSAGNWDEAAKLTPSDGAADDHFGESVSLSGTYAVIGAPDDDDGGGFSGSAYVFARDVSGSWTQAAKLTADDPAAGDYLGEAVAISGGCAIIGAKFDDDKGSSSGSVYVFE